jgi:hypothetical protein
MVRYNETIDIFNGTATSPPPVMSRAAGGLLRRERSPNCKYNSLLDEHEPFDLSHFVPRWWAVQSIDAASCDR